MNRNNLSAAELNEKNKLIYKNTEALRQTISQLQVVKYNQENNDVPSDDNDNEDFKLIEDDSDLEPISDMKQRIMACEQLVGIKFLHYKYENLRREESPPGRWRRVSTDLSISNWFNATIQFIENIEDNDPILQLKWNVEGQLARSELKPLVNFVDNDLNFLFKRLKEYSELSGDRSELIKEFNESFKKFFRIQQGENGIALSWHQNLFQITWSIRYCEYTEEMINFFDIEINPIENDFKRASNQMFEKLLLVNQTIENRKQALMDIGLCAKMYMQQYRS